ncbi:MAG: class I SAM-dependent methyltransferase [Candidatus Krumholzibacteria bacterium]|nr:class I SAM-dependent methyltransferase [Candidatus Krumholzibacteria bacterium]
MSARDDSPKDARANAGAEEVSFGYRRVSAPEKRRLVSGQFDPIARRYDLADALLSFGLHFHWKKWGIGRLALKEGEHVLDVCGGTGDLALLAAARVAPRGRAFVYDFNRPMMRAGRAKVKRSRFAGSVLFVEGDAESLSFPDAVFDAVTVGFGIRNLVHLDRGLSEMHRVLKPGGRIMILEFSFPVRAWFRRLYDVYSFRVMPLGARIICGTAGPFRYLAESIRVFDPPERLADRLKNAGFSDVRFRRLTEGIAVVYLARRR